jgi:hypothetical protein
VVTPPETNRAQKILSVIRKLRERVKTVRKQ